MELYRYGQPIKRLDDRYQLERHLGSGGMAEVWLAWDERYQRKVAIKIIKPNALDEKTLNRFVEEASQLETWSHPHILRVYGKLKLALLNASESSIAPYIVMEYVEGGDLKKRLTEGQPYPFEETLRIFAEICSAVQYAHDRGIVHRDLKPANILFRKVDNGPEQAVLSDFGLAVEVDASHISLPKAGTLAYMAPEQLEGRVQKASDIYALGVILYQLCTGWRPAQKGGCPPGELNADLPKELDSVILKALAKDPAKRFANPSQFAEAVQEAVVVPKRTPLPMLSNNADMASSGESVINGNGAEPNIIKLSPRRSGNISKTFASNAQADPQRNNLSTRRRSAGKMDATGAAKIGGIAAQSQLAQIGTGRRAVTSFPNRVSDGSILRSIRRNPVARWPLAVAMLAFVMLLILGSIAYAASGVLGGLTGIFPFLALSPTATIAITPTTRIIDNGYVITAVTSTPDAAQRQVQARNLSFTTPSQSRTVNATGGGSKTATGTLTFFNGSSSTFSVAVNTVLVASGGVQVENTVPAVIPATDPPNFGTVTVSARAVNAGASGNIRAGAVSGNCCASGNFITVRNQNAFTGGQDPVNYTFVQESDIDGAANLLEQQLQTSAVNTIKGQKKAGEQFVNPSNPLQCTPNISSNHKTGDKATNVTVTVSLGCSAEVYDQQGAETMAVSLYKNDSTIHPGTGFALTSDISTTVGKPTLVDNKGTYSLPMTAQGTWVYQFSSSLAKRWEQRIAGKREQEATTFLLSQQGVSKVNIQLARGNALPTDVNQIAIVILNLSDVSNSTNPASGTSSSSISSSASSTETPTPINGLGGR